MSEEQEVIASAAQVAYRSISGARESALVRYIQTAKAAGYSMRAAMSAFRLAGGVIRTEDFRRLWGE